MQSNQQDNSIPTIVYYSARSTSTPDDSTITHAQKRLKPFRQSRTKRVGSLVIMWPILPLSPIQCWKQRIYSNQHWKRGRGRCDWTNFLSKIVWAPFGHVFYFKLERVYSWAVDVLLHPMWHQCLLGVKLIYFCLRLNQKTDVRDYEWMKRPCLMNFI